MIEHKHVDLLESLSTDQHGHSGRSLLEHLSGTHRLLESWGNAEPVCVAGLFHSIYGTEFYTVRSADLDSRPHIASVIGERAEELSYLFCVTERKGFFAAAGESSAVLTVRESQQQVTTDAVTIDALIEIEIVNCLEQVRPETATPRHLESLERMLALGGQRMSRAARKALQDFLELAAKT